MNITEIKTAIQSGKFDKDFSMLYGDVTAAKERYLKACDSFNELFPNSGEIRLFSAPGRTEVGGNHTDHNNGKVLAAAINLDAVAAVSAREDSIICVNSEGYL